MQYDTADEYTAAIKRTQTSIARVELIGQEHENESGGSSRKTKEVGLSDLTIQLSRLKKEYRSLTGCAFGVQAAW